MLERKVRVPVWVFIAAGAQAQDAYQATSSAPASAGSAEISLLQTSNRSHLAINGTDVYLYAADESFYENPGGVFCGVNPPGAKEFSGHYKLISAKDGNVVSRLDLDPGMTFGVVNPFDGLHAQTDPATGATLIRLNQYGSCNGQSVQLFTVNPSGELHQALFFDGSIMPHQYEHTGPTDGVIPIDSDKAWNFCMYDNSTGQNNCNLYIFDGANFQAAG